MAFKRTTRLGVNRTYDRGRSTVGYIKGDNCYKTAQQLLNTIVRVRSAGGNVRVCVGFAQQYAGPGELYAGAAGICGDAGTNF